MDAAPLMDPLAWLATFALHSTILLGAALLIGRRLGRDRAAETETLYRLAVLGALLTPTLQLGLGFEPFGGHIALERPAPAARDATAEGSAPMSLFVTPELTADERELLLLRGELARLEEGAGEAASGAEGAALFAVAEVPADEVAETPAAFDPGRAALGGWAAIAALGLVLLGLRVRRVHRVLREARVWGSTDLRREFSALCARAGRRSAPEVLISAAGLGPLTAGVLRPRIVLPTRAIAELDWEQRTAVLAHELAHVERRDALASLALSALEALLWFQPLLRLVHRRLKDSAEWLADDRAVELTANPIQLARSLTTVASWRVASPPLASAMVARHSRLEERVGRLLRRPAAAGGRGRVTLTAALALGAIVGVAPAVVPAAPEPTTTDDELEVTMHLDLDPDPDQLGDGSAAEPAPDAELETAVATRPAPKPAAKPEARPAGATDTSVAPLAATSTPVHPLLVALDADLDALRGEADALAADARALGVSAEFEAPLALIRQSLGRLSALRARAGELLAPAANRATTTSRAPGATHSATK